MTKLSKEQEEKVQERLKEWKGFVKARRTTYNSSIARHRQLYKEHVRDAKVEENHILSTKEILKSIASVNEEGVRSAVYLEHLGKVRIKQAVAQAIDLREAGHLVGLCSAKTSVQYGTHFYALQKEWWADAFLPSMLSNIDRSSNYDRQKFYKTLENIKHLQDQNEIDDAFGMVLLSSVD